MKQFQKISSNYQKVIKLMKESRKKLSNKFKTKLRMIALKIIQKRQKNKKNKSSSKIEAWS